MTAPHATPPPVIARWLDFMSSGDTATLADLLDENAVFYSPAVFTPQAGRDKTIAYLLAAEKVFGAADFRYLEHWYNERSAVLQFTADLDGTVVEGIDMIAWNDDDKITSFKVMVRPLKALQALIPRMGQLLAEQG
ncbi:nuclear transport factor 2 family protein [[Mycobacterium] burgundiense]|uniref:Nuclear transport factor 2 family protein n=1 Tax=[Mycobacterium] burgundiense TaxID=3064286 RepID=A0ABM9M3T5_9MYCO|nr:nuclear transport factor 2 family protein [Mycolicibacterium sp. MU0053]CAJ1509761.1 nuclear transport factor 2 family protein [Mycolicibacterium sp. MU0053]